MQKITCLSFCKGSFGLKFGALWANDRAIATNLSPNSVGFSAICSGRCQYLWLSEMTRIIILDTSSICNMDISWHARSTMSDFSEAMQTCEYPTVSMDSEVKTGALFTVLLMKIFPFCCRLNLQTSICSQRMELVVASGKLGSCGTRRRGAPGCSQRRSGTKCARWTLTAGLGWRQALELIRKHKRSVRKAKTAKTHCSITPRIPCVQPADAVTHSIVPEILTCFYLLFVPLQGRFVRSPSLLQQALEEES